MMTFFSGSDRAKAVAAGPFTRGVSSIRLGPIAGVAHCAQEVRWAGIKIINPRHASFLPAGQARAPVTGNCPFTGLSNTDIVYPYWMGKVE